MSAPTPIFPGPTAKTGGTAKTSVIAFGLLILGAVLAFGTTLIVGRVAGQAGAGTFFQVMALFNIAVVGTTLGADTGLVRELSARLAVRRAQDVPAVLRIALLPVACASAVVGVVVWFAADPLAEALGLPGVGAALRLAAPLLPVGAVMTALFGALRGLGRVRIFSVLQNLLLPVLRLAGVLIAIAAGAGVLRLTGAWALPVLIVGPLAALAVARSFRRALASQRVLEGSVPLDELDAEFAAQATGEVAATRKPPTWRGFWSFSSARGVSALVETALEWVDVLSVGLFLGPAAGGAYGAVNRCIRLGVMVDQTARIVTGPLVSSSMARGDHDAAKTLYRATTMVLVAAAWPFYLTVAVFSPVILDLFGPGFDVAAVPMSVIALAMMVVVSCGGVQSVLLMAGRSRWQLLNKCTALVVALALCLTLIPAWGLMGAVTAWAASVLVDTALATVQVWRLLGFAPPFASAVPAALSALICFGGVGLGLRLWLGESWSTFFAALVIGGAAYACTVLARPWWFGVQSLLVRRGVAQ